MPAVDVFFGYPTQAVTATQFKNQGGYTRAFKYELTAAQFDGFVANTAFLHLNQGTTEERFKTALRLLFGAFTDPTRIGHSITILPIDDVSEDDSG